MVVSLGRVLRWTGERLLVEGRDESDKAMEEQKMVWSNEADGRFGCIKEREAV